MEASEEMVSTRRRAGCFASSMALRTSGTRVTAPVEVSLWTTHTALMACPLSAASRSWMAADSAPRRQSPGMRSISRPRRRASLHHREAKCPDSYMSTLSPGERTFTSAASQAPVPEAG